MNQCKVLDRSEKGKRLATRECVGLFVPSCLESSLGPKQYSAAATRAVVDRERERERERGAF